MYGRVSAKTADIKSHKVPDKRYIEANPPTPDPSRVEQLARETLGRLKEAQEQLHHDADEVHTQRDRNTDEQARLEQGHTQLEEQQNAVEQQTVKLEAMADELEKHRREFQASLTELEDERRSITAKQDELNSHWKRAAEEREAQNAAAAALAEKEASVLQAEKDLQAQMRELEPKWIEIRQREKELQTRAEQLDGFAAELNETRDTLACLQSQLADGQRDVAAQREELLNQLGGAHHIPVPAILKSTEHTGFTPSSKAEAFPKPAAGRAAEQFRKLRRDAKRKAIGA